ncbi:MAG: hypothetical protein JO145_12340 [Acidobacteriaceae bacterium]|nr:hypothetical protein [Acidobacteriaceae bacterium]MBV9766581.1 hypothetical protein [Acidobacteriaceae bacterium]
MLAISQPHLHNVLKGARKINPELADRLLRKFGLSVLHLLEDAELAAEVIARGLLPLDTPATKHARFRNNPGTHVADDE